MNDALNTRSISAIGEGAYVGLWPVSVDGYSWVEGLHAPLGSRRHPMREGVEIGPWLAPRGTSTKDLRVMQKSAVLKDLIEVGRSVSLSAVVKFANKYGALFNPHYDPPGVANRGRSNDIYYLDSYNSWSRESQRVAVLARLWEWVLDERETRLSPFIWFDREKGAHLLRVVSTKGEPNAELTRRTFPGGGEEGKSPPPDNPGFEYPIEKSVRGRSWTANYILEPARHGIRQQVNARLAGHVFMQVMHFDGDPIRFVPDSLLAAVYAHFALQIIGGRARQRECENPTCKEPLFIASRRDQRFCSKGCRELAFYHRSKVRQFVTKDDDNPDDNRSRQR